MNSALLIIDLQNDFCPGGALAVEGGDRIVATINAMIPRYDFVVATRDWHPAGHVSFASSHAGAQPFDSVIIDGRTQTLWPDHCRQGTPGAELHPQLRTEGLHCILHKGFRRAVDSYSAFIENDGTTPTGLEYLLRGLGIGRVELCGLATDVCVLHSALDARRLGFDTVVAIDACRSVDPMSRAATTKCMQDAGIQVVPNP